VRLNPGESREIQFTMSDRDLGYYNAQGQWLVEPGKYHLWLTKDSASGEPLEFELAR
jgi:beta-glucosidase